MNIDNLKQKFPRYKITDASNRTAEEICRISMICDKVKNVLVFVERNSKNKSYFECFEKADKMPIGSFKYMILTEQTMLIQERDDYTSYILNLQRMLNNEVQCPICLEETLKEYMYCNQCAHACCAVCYNKLNKRLCPTCRYESFSAMSIEGD